MLCVAVAFTCFGIIIGISIMELVIIHEIKHSGGKDVKDN